MRMILGPAVVTAGVARLAGRRRDLDVDQAPTFAQSMRAQIEGGVLGD